MNLYDSEKKNKDNKRKFNTTLFKKRDALVSNFVDIIKSK